MLRNDSVESSVSGIDWAQLEDAYYDSVLRQLDEGEEVNVPAQANCSEASDTHDLSCAFADEEALLSQLPLALALAARRLRRLYTAVGDFTTEPYDSASVADDAMIWAESSQAKQGAHEAACVMEGDEFGEDVYELMV